MAKKPKIKFKQFVNFKITTAWLILLALVIFIGEADSQNYQNPRTHEAVGFNLGLFVVSQVIDGDTIIIKSGSNPIIDGAYQGQVRLIGIDTPEIGQPWADEATALIRLLVEGKTVRLERDIQLYDKYQRLLAYVYLDDDDSDQSNDIMVNYEIVRAGLARVLSITPDIKKQALFYQGEMLAKSEHLRLWETK